MGRELALIFAREGAAGLSLSARHGEAIRSVRDEVREIAPNANILAIEADVSKPKDIERLIATTLDAFGGRLDVLVNNASTIGPSPMPYLLDYPLEDFQNVLNTNLIGPFLITKGAFARDDRKWWIDHKCLQRRRLDRLSGLGRIRYF